MESKGKEQKTFFSAEKKQSYPRKLSQMQGLVHGKECFLVRIWTLCHGKQGKGAKNIIFRRKKTLLSQETIPDSGTFSGKRVFFGEILDTLPWKARERKQKTLFSAEKKQSYPQETIPDSGTSSGKRVFFHEILDTLP